MKDDENGDKSNSLQVNIPIYPNIINTHNMNMQETKTKLNNSTFSNISFQDINLKYPEKKKSENDLITIKKKINEDGNEIKIEGEEEENEKEDGKDKENNMIKISNNLIEDEDNKESQQLEDLLSEKDFNNENNKEQNNNLLKINNIKNEKINENEQKKKYFKFKSLYSDKEHIIDEETKISNLININLDNNNTEKEKEKEEEDFDFENNEENNNSFEEKKINEKEINKKDNETDIKKLNEKEEEKREEKYKEKEEEKIIEKEKEEKKIIEKDETEKKQEEEEKNEEENEEEENAQLIDEYNNKEEGKKDEKQSEKSDKNSQRDNKEEINHETEENNKQDKEEEKNEFQTNQELGKNNEKSKIEQEIKKIEDKKNSEKEVENENANVKLIEKDSDSNESSESKKSYSKKESKEIIDINNIKKEENYNENEELYLNNNINNAKNDIISTHDEIKEPTQENEEKKEVVELENNTNQKMDKIIDGVNIFNNYINIQYKILFINLLKQRNSFLVKIKYALINLEKTIFQIKLFRKKKYFFNKLPKKAPIINKERTSSKKPTNVMFKENIDFIDYSKTDSKIKNRIKKLEFIKQRESEYIDMIEKQKQKKQELIESINLKIKRQKLEETPKKNDDIIIHSDRSSSELSDYYEPRNNFKNGFEILIFLFKKNIQKNEIIFLENLNDKITTRKNISRKTFMRNKIFSTKKMPSKNYDDNKPKYLNKILDLKAAKSVSSSSLELEEEDESNKSGFIKLREPNYNLEKKPDKKQLSEYDLFYKEQFFQNELFVYDVENIEDKVEAEIKKEMNRLDLKQKLIAKKKLKEVNDLKNLNTKELQLEINDLQEQYNNIKKKAEPKIELEMNNTEGYLHFGRMLGNYFRDEEEINFPKFALESEKQTAARDVIDFKLLRKEEVARRYFDYCCCLEQRKKINKALVYARYFCRFFVDNWIFDNLSLLIIIINTILILISDPTDPNNIGNTYDNYFLIFYTLEAILKIISFRFITAEDAYIKDAWNILDFFVVIIGWISFILEHTMNGTKISGLAGLRAFRILRPFKTVKRFKGLKKLVTALLASIGHLGETSIVLFFFFLIFSIAGTQMWQGLFFRRCMSVNYGYLVSTQQDTGMCSFDVDCEQYNTYGENFICAKGYRNPNSGAVNFDNTLSAFVTVFVMVTLEGWTDIFTYVNKTFKDKIYINTIIIFFYFHTFIFIAAFYLINLFLAVTNSEFEHIETSRKQLKEKKSFFKLIKDRYDVKEREKKERKEKERQLKASNNKKSNETLRELYYKITDEAFHMNTNKRNIPIEYSTVKDMYIMTNQNPENLYIQSKRIDEEETFLSKDIKRQQREIDELMSRRTKEEKQRKKNFKKISMKNESNIKENLRRVKTTNSFALKNRTNINKKENYSDKNIVQSTTKNMVQITNKEEIVKNNKEFKKRKSKTFNLQEEIMKSEKMKKQISKEILRELNDIKIDLIDISIDNTQKFLKDKINDISKHFNTNFGKKKKKNENKNENNDELDIGKFADLNTEKRDKERKVKRTTQRIRKKRMTTKQIKMEIEEQNKKNIGDLSKLNLFGKNIDEEKRKIKLPQQLSIINDLSLSDCENNLNRNKLLLMKQQHVGEQLLREKSLKLLNSEDEKENKEEEMNQENKKLISIDNDDSNTSILKERKVLVDVNNNFNVISKFMKPKSNLDFLSKQRKKEFNKKRLLFIEEKYKLKKKGTNKEQEKESENISENSILQRQEDESFLEFVNNIHNRENIDDKKIDEDKSFTKSLLEADKSLISFHNELSLDDINLLPKEIYNKKIYKLDYLQNESIRKNVKLCKLVELIRSSFFDRESINTNINLTTKQQSDYYRQMNKRLNNLLVVDIKKVRGRNENKNNLNVSYVWNNYNSEKFFYKKKDKLKGEEESEIDELDINNISRQPIKELMKGYRGSILLDRHNESNKVIQQINLEEKKNDKENEFEVLETEQKLIDKKKTVKFPKSMIRNSEFIYSNENLLGKKKEKLKVSFKDKKKSQELPKKQINQLDINKSQNNFNENAQIKNQEPILMERSRQAHSKKNIMSLNYFKKIRQNVLNKKNKTNLTIIGQNPNSTEEKKYAILIYKAKSIEKNIKKYPKENSKAFEIKEENKNYEDPLTVIQEKVPDNLRGKKYYLNYIYNIKDKDLKVKDNFKVDHWENEIFGKKQKCFKKKPLPENREAFFVFNDKKLNLQKYLYMHHEDMKFQEKDLSYLTHNLKYFPLNVMELLPMRLRNFGSYAVGKEINPGIIGTKPMSMNHDSFKSSGKIQKSKSHLNKPRNKTSIITGSSYANHTRYQEEILFRKNIYERIFKKINELNYNALSHYFLLEEKLYYQIADQKRKKELIQKNIERNREKENRFEVKEEIMNILEFDIKTNSRKYIQWSGSDVLSHQEDNDKNRKIWNSMINSLEDFNIIIWHKNVGIQRFQKLRYAFYILANNDYFDYAILSIVIINSIFMALDGNLIKPEIIKKIEISNYLFNSIFILEYIVKFIGLTPFVYYSDAFTYLDTLIITFAILDMSSPEEDSNMSNVSSQLSFLRVFRIFRVIRLTKILRRLKSMRLIIVSIKKALSNVSYIVCILIMFILIFQLLGMSLLSGNYHYRSFFIGFYTTYQILTLENWNSLLYEIWPMNYFCFFYFVAWIFIGNYVIFNLFISILLQSFDEEEEEDEDDLTLDEKIEKIYLLPAYLNMVKHSLHKNKNKKLKSYRKKFNKNEDNENEVDNINDDESLLNSKSFSQIITSNNFKDSYFKSSSFNERENSFELSRSIELKSHENNVNDEESDEYQSSVEQKMAFWKQVNAIFAKNECEYSLYVLPQTSHFRIFCMKLIVNVWFDRFILFLILCSTARLVVDTFVSGYEFVLTFDILDAVFNTIFLLECLFKIFAMGFVLDEGSYLRDNWNKIDIIIVICSIFDFQNLFTKYFSSGHGTSSVQFLKVIRLLRTLRPLRFISHNVQLKLIITSLFDSILPICNALFIVIVVYYMFSIVGISLFYTNMHNCYIMKEGGTAELASDDFDSYLSENNVNDNMISILDFCSDRFNGIMDTGPAFKFSNIITSFITAYVLSTMEGWPDIMNSYNIYGNYYGIYFIVYNLVVAYFFLNLFTGIMFRCFNEAFKREQKIAEGDKKAPKYYDFLTQICNAETHYIVWKKPKEGSFFYILREFADSSYLDNFIMVVIFLNMIFMALSYEGSSSSFNLFLTIVNYIFTGIFIIECLIKLIAYGIRPYFHSSWNRFDFFVVIASIVDLAVANIEGFDASFLKSFQIIRVLRVMRITRVLRLIKSLKGLEKLIQTLSWSLTALANVLLLMLIFFCIFAILGCYFYDSIVYKDYKDIFVYVNEYYNFDNFYDSFLLVFRCATGENWNNIMMEYAFIDTDKVSEVYAYIYFIISNFINSIIMLNLFLMVTLQQYDEFTNKNYNPIEKFESFLIDFNNAWNKFSDDENEGFRIKKIYVTNFFSEFNWKKLNFPEQGKNEAIKKYITELRLRTDDEDYVYYHDVIYKIINKQMGSLIDRNNPDNNTIFKKEIKVQKEIRHMINDYINKKSKKTNKKQKNMLITYNPLTSHLYFKTSFLYLKTFLNYYKKNAELLQNIDEQQSKKSSSLK